MKLGPMIQPPQSSLHFVGSSMDLAPCVFVKNLALKMTDCFDCDLNTPESLCEMFRIVRGRRYVQHRCGQGQFGLQKDNQVVLTFLLQLLRDLGIHSFNPPSRDC